MNDSDQKPQLHIDSDWKAEAQREKDRLAEKEELKSSTPSGAEEMPPAEFRSLIGMLTQQALMGLGVMGDQKSGRLIVDLEGSQFYIDLLDVLEQKTKGNLTAEEAKELTEVLAELRSRFVYLSKLVAEQGTMRMANPTDLGGSEGAPFKLRQPDGV